MPLPDALEFTLKWEGGYVNHPNDPGGETYRGITKRSHADWPGWAKIRILEPTRNAIIPELEADVREFYREHYWNPVRGDELPPLVATSVFDHAVHSGVARASRALQRKIGVPVDGRIGPHTIKATWRWCDELGAVDLIGYRKRWLEALAKKRPSLRVFARGWQRRIDDLFAEVQGRDS
jgi:lysozyme family protein